MPLGLFTLICLSLYSFTCHYSFVFFLARLLFLYLGPRFQLFIGVWGLCWGQSSYPTWDDRACESASVYTLSCKVGCEGGGKRADGGLESWVRDVQVPICELYNSLEHPILGGSWGLPWLMPPQDKVTMLVRTNVMSGRFSWWALVAVVERSWALRISYIPCFLGSVGLL